MPSPILARLVRVAAPCSLALALACREDEPPDLTGMEFVSQCDPDVTIRFESSESAVANTNYCEGYTPETWDYAITDDELTMALRGQLGQPNAATETFRISDDAATLTLIDSSGLLTCGNCEAGDTWVRQ